MSSAASFRMEIEGVPRVDDRTDCGEERGAKSEERSTNRSSLPAPRPSDVSPLASSFFNDEGAL